MYKSFRVFGVLIVGLVIIAGCVMLPNRQPALKRPALYTFPAEDKVFPEGIALVPNLGSNTGDFFAGSAATGAVYRGNLDLPALALFLAGQIDGRTAVFGMKVDPQRRLW